MRSVLVVSFSLIAALGSAWGGDADVIAPTNDFSKAEKYETNQGGAGTSYKTANRNAFSHPSENMDFVKRLDFQVGNGVFRKLWASSPSSTKASDGLGPLFNARACQRCHLKDGRGHPPTANWPDDNAISMLVRLSVPPSTPEEHELLADGRASVIPEPLYGGQLQDLAIQGHEPEGRIHISYAPVSVELADGETIELRDPTLSITDVGYGPMAPNTMMSARVAPAMIGLGLLEAISEADILALADPDDLDGDGISGVANRVWSNDLGAVTLGRFGWKAGQPSLRQQNSSAFSGDMGIGTSVFPAVSGDCTAMQEFCLQAPHGAAPNDFEVQEIMLDAVVFYTRNLAVPARRDVDDPDVLAGKRLFYESGCIGCHVSKFITRSDATESELSRQLIWPYTDMLLHDLGEGLADNRPEARASGQEWRTPPLWGIGLTETVSGHTFYLHDGRARSLLEAILWHGGEAESSRNKVVEMSAEDRAKLLGFLNSL